MTSTFVLSLFGLLVAGPSAPAAAAGPEPALVLVALPGNPDTAILEALNRLRGEAMSVGFEVRLLEAGTDPGLLDQSGGARWRAAAVVTVMRPDPGVEGPGSLDVTFIDRSTGKTSAAHFTPGEVDDAQERADVIIAVRAVDFIRARMFDTLAGRRNEPPPAPAAPPPPPPPRSRRYHVAAGVAVLGTPSGFAPTVAPRLAVGYWPAKWLRFAVTAEGLGSEPDRWSDAGRIRLDQRFIGADVALASPAWHRGRLLLAIGGGEHWVTVRGDPIAPFVGRTVTLASLAASSAAGLLLEVLPYLSLELRAGTLWLEHEARISATDAIYLGSFGLPLWFASASAAARF